MLISTHCNTRMNQRGIRKGLVELALDLGDVEGDRYVLNSKIIKAEMSALQRKMRLLDEAEKKGGITVVADGDTLITAFRTDSFNVNLSK